MNDMALPDGKQCGDCRHFNRCEGLFQCKPHSVECDWSPSRFAQRSVLGFSVMSRVRIRCGADRGHYGTIIHKGGDDGTYYGVKLDCDSKEVGYSEYELEPA